jgi:hypothetical protein
VMLGTRRSTVTVAAGMLHKAGLIEYSRGNVTIHNRHGLEDVACECYTVIQASMCASGCSNSGAHQCFFHTAENVE